MLLERFEIEIEIVAEKRCQTIFFKTSSPEEQNSLFSVDQIILRHLRR